MKKSFTFFGLGILIVAFLGFLIRMINVPVFQGRMFHLILFGSFGLALIISSFIFKSGKKFLLWFGLGSLLYALAIFGLRVIGLDNNITLFIIALIIGLVLLIIGLFK
jgi:hypothetical protein